MDRTESLPPIRARAAAVPARPLPAALVAFLALLLASVAVATPAHAASGSDLEARFVAAVNAAFMASPSHRANLLDPAWTEVGLGVVVVDGRCG